MSDLAQSRFGKLRRDALFKRHDRLVHHRRIDPAIDRARAVVAHLHRRASVIETKETGKPRPFLRARALQRRDAETQRRREREKTKEERMKDER